jgi:IS5 family transposase
MTPQLCRPLFPWDELADSPSLQAIRALLASIPDERLLHLLAQRRHNGCDKYPVRVLWGCLLLAILLRYPSMEACLEELRRNAGLRLLIDVEREQDVPNGWNLSRFLAVLGSEPFLAELVDIFDVMARHLGEAVADLGRHTAGDATALSGRLDPDEGRRAEEVKQGLPQPSGGRKEYKDDDGKVTKVVEWFGYKLHLLVDAKHEVALAYHITDTKAGDNEEVEALLAQAQANLPEGRIETLAYDKAADDVKVHEALTEVGVKPVIQNRACWPKDGEQEKVIGGRIPLHVVHDEPGTVYCYDTSAPPVRRAMSYMGHEKGRGTLKYRCPARVEGFACPAEERCNAGKSYGMTVRVPQEIDLRRFPAIPRATKQFERLYKGRTSVERVNGRLKVFWGIDDGNVVGARRFHAHVGAVMVVHLAFATALARQQQNEGSFGKMKL